MTDSKKAPALKPCSKLKALSMKLSNGYFFIKRVLSHLSMRYRALALPMKVTTVAGLGVVFLLILVALYPNPPQTAALSTLTPKASAKPVNTNSPPEPSLVMTSPVNEGLTDLQAKLAHIETLLSRKDAVLDIDKVRDEIHSLNQQIAQIEAANQAQYTALRAQIKGLSEQVGAYQKTTASKLDAIVAIKTKVRCLSGAHLPFRVQSIDEVNGTNVVSVLYANQVTPLETNFSLAGW